jgi:hypothetical protein
MKKQKRKKTPLAEQFEPVFEHFLNFLQYYSSHNITASQTAQIWAKKRL